MEHNLYIIKSSNEQGDKLIKFGYSSKIKERLNQYYSHNPFTEILYTFYREDAIAFEKDFHENNTSIYKNKWYSIDILENLLIQIKTKIFVEYTKKEKKKYKRNKPKIIVCLLEKCCSKCNKIKKSELFHKDVYEKGGISRICKECTVEINRYYRNKK